MSRISIYVIKEISSSFLLIFSLITVVVWLSQAMRHLELLSSDNVTISTYIFYTFLLLPKLFLITIPVSIFIGIIFALNKLRIDSELIIFGSTGNSNRDILLKPLLLISMFFFIIMIFLSIYLVPKSSAEIRGKLIEIRSTSISASILKEKRFITPDSKLTVFFKSVKGQDIFGLLLHDRSEENNIKTYVAKRGYLNTEGSSNNILLYDGVMQIYNEEQKKISEVNFDSYVIDLATFDKIEKKYFYADEISTINLIKKIKNKKFSNEDFAALHNRFIRALYIFSLVFLPLIIFKVIRKPDDKSTSIMISILLIGLFIKFFEITMESILITNNHLLFINYIAPLIIQAVIIMVLFFNFNVLKRI